MEHVGDFGAFAERIARTLHGHSGEVRDELPVQVLIVQTPRYQTELAGVTDQAVSLATLALDRAGVPAEERAVLPHAGNTAALAELAPRFANGDCHVLIAPSEHLRQGVDLQALFGSRPYVSHYTSSPAMGPARKGTGRGRAARGVGH